MSAERFLQAAERAFGGLHELGFAVVKRRRRAPEASLKMRNATTELAVTQELGGKLWVKISALGCWRGEVVAAEGYDLVFLLQERSPEALSSLQQAQDAAETLELAAKYAWAYGEDLLRGDFSVFPQLRARAEENLRRAEAQL